MDYSADDFKKYFDWLHPIHQQLVIDIVMQKSRSSICDENRWEEDYLDYNIDFIINHWVQYNLQTLDKKTG